MRIPASLLPFREALGIVACLILCMALALDQTPDLVWGAILLGIVAWGLRS